MFPYGNIESARTCRNGAILGGDRQCQRALWTQMFPIGNIQAQSSASDAECSRPGTFANAPDPR